MTRRNEWTFHLQEALDGLWALYQHTAMPGGLGCRTEGVTAAELADYLNRSETAVGRKIRSLRRGSAIRVVNGTDRKSGTPLRYMPVAREMTEDLADACVGDDRRRVCPVSGAPIGRCAKCGRSGQRLGERRGEMLCRDCLCGGYEPIEVTWRRSSPISMF